MKSDYLVLFDIDGTLLNAKNLHTEAYRAVFLEIFGLEEILWPDFSGRTELWLIRKIAEVNGISSKEISSKLPEVIIALGDYYGSHLKEETGELTPGIQILLKELDRRNIIRGIVTGNIETIADLKLKHFGIYGGFKLGKYGSDHDDRAILLAQAKSEALQKFSKLSPQNIIYVGDTPLDILTAHKAGIRALAVKTNPDQDFSFKEANPGLIMESLRDVPRFIKYLYSCA